MPRRYMDFGAGSTVFKERSPKSLEMIQAEALAEARALWNTLRNSKKEIHSADQINRTLKKITEKLAKAGRDLTALEEGFAGSEQDMQARVNQVVADRTSVAEAFNQTLTPLFKARSLWRKLQEEEQFFSVQAIETLVQKMRNFLGQENLDITSLVDEPVSLESMEKLIAQAIVNANRRSAESKLSRIENHPEKFASPTLGERDALFASIWEHLGVCADEGAIIQAHTRIMAAKLVLEEAVQKRRSRVLQGITPLHL